MEEIWTDIKDYNGEYQISTLGRIKSFKQDPKGKIMKPIIRPNGYIKINLYKNGNMTTYSLHRLVAETFIPNPNNYPEVNHKDCNPSNCAVSNLEWCTRQYNNTYGERVEKQARAQGKPVRCLETGEIYYSSVEAGRKLNINSRLIRGVCEGAHKTTHGLHFEWVTKKGEE